MLSLGRVWWVALLAWVVAASGGMIWASPGMLDQSFTLSANPSLSGFGVTTSQSVAQTFTCGMDGMLSGLDLQVWKNSQTVLDLTVEIRRTRPDTGELLATRTVPVSAVPSLSFPTPTLVPVDLSTAGIAVNPGDVLAIVLSSAEPYTPVRGYQWAATNQFIDGYTGGDAWRRRPDLSWYAATGTRSQDMGFQTYVVPEPATSAVLGVGAWLLMMSRRRRVTRLAAV